LSNARTFRQTGSPVSRETRRAIRRRFVAGRWKTVRERRRAASSRLDRTLKMRAVGPFLHVRESFSTLSSAATSMIPIRDLSPLRPLPQLRPAKSTRVALRRGQVTQADPAHKTTTPCPLPLDATATGQPPMAGWGLHATTPGSIGLGQESHEEPVRVLMSHGQSACVQTSACPRLELRPVPCPLRSEAGAAEAIPADLPVAPTAAAVAVRVRAAASRVVQGVARVAPAGGAPARAAAPIAQESVGGVLPPAQVAAVGGPTARAAGRIPAPARGGNWRVGCSLRAGSRHSECSPFSFGDAGEIRKL